MSVELIPKGPSEIRHNNRGALLGELLRHGSASRTQLASRTGLTATAITRISRELIDLGLLHETDMQERDGQPGRRGVSLDFRAEGAFVIGVGIHASDHSVSLANLRGEVVQTVQIPVELHRDSVRTFGFVRDTVDEMLTQCESKNRAVLGIAVAIAGVVDNTKRTIKSMPQQGWEQVRLDPFFQHTGLPLVVENVNNTLNLAEWRFGVSRHCDNVLMMRVSAYVGASAIANGRLMRGSRSGAMMIGHMRATGLVSDRAANERRRCTCGRLGCVNTVFSGQAIVCEADNKPWDAVLAADVGRNTARLEEILRAADAGDERIRAILCNAGTEAGTTLAELARIQDPDFIVIGGHVGQCKTFIDGIKTALTDAGTSHMDGEMPAVVISSMTVSQATVYMALDQFAFSARLNIRALEQANRLNADSSNKLVPR
ncbi:MAG: ROK family transcriptional regulator [Burkholderiaceae bacterium]